ncbi:hypothetical protein USB125703_01659 [Pseudoclavibacter triregionum]|nr:hypothetical protein USB125703_01659 [Pseudoclavibacter triregionum]
MDTIADASWRSLAELLPQAAVLGLQPHQLIGISLALLGAVFMSLGAKYQHQGVSKVEHAREQGRIAAGEDVAAGETLGAGQLAALLRRPSWLIGTGMLGLAIALQLTSLAFAPLIVVQPLGVVSLILTTVLTARDSGHRLSRMKAIAVTVCVLGVSIFVTLAAMNSVERHISNLRIAAVLIILGVVVVLFGLAFALLRTRFKAVFYIVGAGVLYGFVATLAKITINRIQHGDVELLTWICIAMLLLGTAVGAYFVQTAYASGPPDMVVAGLTVIDPLVAVLIGIAVLGETDGASILAYLGFAAAGLIAISGVFLLERGQTQEEIAASRQAAVSGRVSKAEQASQAEQAASVEGAEDADAAENPEDAADADRRG